MNGKKLKAYPRLNDHGANCKGHANFMLDSDMTDPGHRDSVIAAIGNYLHEADPDKAPVAS